MAVSSPGTWVLGEQKLFTDICVELTQQGVHVGLNVLHENTQGFLPCFIVCTCVLFVCHLWRPALFWRQNGGERVVISSMSLFLYYFFYVLDYNSYIISPFSFVPLFPIHPSFLSSSSWPLFLHCFVHVYVHIYIWHVQFIHVIYIYIYIIYV